MATEGRLCYYVSLPFFKHKILKCAGGGAEDEVHRAFYEPYFRKNGAFDEKGRGGPFIVIIRTYVGDKIDDTGEPVVVNMFGKVIRPAKPEVIGPAKPS